MTFVPNITLHAIRDEISKVETATKQAIAQGADKERAATLLNGLQKMQDDLKALCLPQEECVFVCPFGPPPSKP